VIVEVRVGASNGLAVLVVVGLDFSFASVFGNTSPLHRLKCECYLAVLKNRAFNVAFVSGRCLEAFDRCFFIPERFQETHTGNVSRIKGLLGKI
jgi:hypothetical protein